MTITTRSSWIEYIGNYFKYDVGEDDEFMLTDFDFSWLQCVYFKFISFLTSKNHRVNVANTTHKAIRYLRKSNMKSKQESE